MRVPVGLSFLALLDVSVALPSRHLCDGPKKPQGAKGFHVYNIRSTAAKRGVTNKNAADTLGDLSFIFGAAGYPQPRGVENYYQGIVEMNHMGVPENSWGDFLQCNHPENDYINYKCVCPTYNGNKQQGCNLEKPGRMRNSHSGNNLWYSFPANGEGKYWAYNPETPKGCRPIQIQAKCVIDLLAQKAIGRAPGCDGSCSPATSAKCAGCVNRLSDEEKRKVWDNAIWDGGCSDLMHPEDPTNRRRSSMLVYVSRRRSEGSRLDSNVSTSVDSEKESSDPVVV